MTTQIDETKLHDLLMKVVGDMGAAFNTALVVLGDKLGLYKALAEAPATPAELADRTGTNERYVSEWLNGQAAGGYVNYDATAARYSMTPEQAAAFADPTSPAFMAGAFDIAAATIHAEPRIRENFKTGKGMPWGEHHTCLFGGTESFFRASYIGNLINNWIPALDGVKERLEAGCTVADVGCGHGASTVLMAEAFPNSTFVGFDYHEQNHNPVGRVFYGASTMLCVPCSLALDGPALGAQAGQERLGKFIKDAGFTRQRRATETPFNLVLEARP